MTKRTRPTPEEMRRLADHIEEVGKASPIWKQIEAEIGRLVRALRQRATALAASTGRDRTAVTIIIATGLALSLLAWPPSRFAIPLPAESEYAGSRQHFHDAFCAFGTPCDTPQAPLCYPGPGAITRLPPALAEICGPETGYWGDLTPPDAGGPFSDPFGKMRPQR